MSFRYRQSRQYLVFFDPAADYIDEGDPPLRVPGDVFLSLDPHGRLRHIEVVRACRQLRAAFRAAGRLESAICDGWNRPESVRSRRTELDSSRDIRHARRMDRHTRAFAIDADARRSGGLARPTGVLSPEQ